MLGQNKRLTLETWQATATAEEEDQAEPKPEPKAKNPLDELPKSSMVLDSWKRLYSNTPGAKFREIAVQGLWQGADIPNSPTQEVPPARKEHS